jgi:hypothetical protein
MLDWVASGARAVRKRRLAAARLAPSRSEGRAADPAPPRAIAMLLKQLGHMVDTPLRLELR